MNAKTEIAGSDLFLKYLNGVKDQVNATKTEGYFHVNVVAEAYSQGFADGKKSGRQDFIKQIIKNQVEKFTQKSNQIYILSQNLISYIKDEGFNVSSLYIKLTLNRPSVILAVENVLLLNDDFVSKAYAKVYENRKIFLKLFNENLDIGFIGIENLDKKMLSEEGYGYHEEY
jgi:hypothetical protein